jgi:hypothetical protein
LSEAARRADASKIGTFTRQFVKDSTGKWRSSRVPSVAIAGRFGKADPATVEHPGDAQPRTGP